MTMKKPSLRTAIKNYLGKLPDSGLDYKTLQNMVKDGEVDSAYSHVKNKTEFSMVRWGPFGDMQTWPEFQNLWKEGVLSYEHDSLGELLQTANFYGEGETIEQELYKDIIEEGNTRFAMENEKVYQESLQFLKKLNINPQKQQPFLVQSGVKIQNLVDFVSHWWHHGGHKTNRWNPDYAKPLQSEQFYDLIRKTKTAQWQKKLNPWEMEKRSRPITRSEWDEDTHLGTYSSAKTPLSFVFLPVDGWTLAECFRILYKK